VTERADRCHVLCPDTNILPNGALPRHHDHIVEAENTVQDQAAAAKSIHAQGRTVIDVRITLALVHTAMIGVVQAGTIATTMIVVMTRMIAVVTTMVGVAADLQCSTDVVTSGTERIPRRVVVLAYLVSVCTRTRETCATSLRGMDQ